MPAGDLPRPASRLDDPRDSETLAYAAGRRDAEVDSYLQGHERRLNAINGSIERHAREAAAQRQELAALRGTVEGMDGKLDQITTSLASAAAVEEDRVKQVAQANEKQISTRTFVLGVITICVVFLIGCATVYATLHAGGH